MSVGGAAIAQKDQSTYGEIWRAEDKKCVILILATKGQRKRLWWRHGRDLVCIQYNIIYSTFERKQDNCNE